MNIVDIFIFRSFNSWARFSPLTDDIIIFFSDNFGYLILVTALFAIFFIKKPTFQQFLGYVLALSGGAFVARFVVTEIVRTLWWRLRPFEVLTNVHQLISHAGGGSFPSGHAAFYFAVAGGLYFIDKRLGVLMLVGSLLIGVARVASGIHWPSDILGGLAIGMLCGFVAGRIIKKIEPR